MTPYSLDKLLEFLNVYASNFNSKTRVGDFGGGAEFSSKTREALRSGGLEDYTPLDYDTGVDLDKPVKGKKFGLGLCMDTLEHCTHPWLVAKNISDALLPGAYLFVTAPFAWERHNYPGDYFRYTENGLKSLFDKLEYIEGCMGRDIQLKEADKGQSQIPDELFIRIRAFAVFRKPMKGRKQPRKQSKIGYAQRTNYLLST